MVTSIKNRHVARKFVACAMAGCLALSLSPLLWAGNALADEGGDTPTPPSSQPSDPGDPSTSSSSDGGTTDPGTTEPGTTDPSTPSGSDSSSSSSSIDGASSGNTAPIVAPAPKPAPVPAAKAKATVSKKSGVVRTIKVKKTSKLSGSVTYKLYSKGKTYSGKNGKAIGSKKKVARALSVKLTGSVASKYNVYYRVYADGYGWMGWAKNGAKAGTANKNMKSCQVKLVAKTAAQPNMDRKAYSSKTGFVNKITGDKKVDAAIKKVAKSNKMSLTKCLKWANGKIAYSPTGRSTLTKTSKYSTSRFKTEAKSAFVTKRGDCYTYTAAGAALAKYLGYTANVTVGKYTSSTGKVQTYSWTTIKVKGKSYIYDVTNNRLAISPSNALYAQFKKVA